MISNTILTKKTIEKIKDVIINLISYFNILFLNFYILIILIIIICTRGVNNTYEKNKSKIKTLYNY
jgi:hypothetical protein